MSHALSFYPLVLCHLLSTSQCSFVTTVITQSPSLVKERLPCAGSQPHHTYTYALLLAQQTTASAKMDRHCADMTNRHNIGCCSPDTVLPLPVCFSEESIQRQLGYLLNPCPSLRLRTDAPCAPKARHTRCQPVHTAFVPALLYVPAYYIPTFIPCLISDASCDRKRADSAVAVSPDIKPSTAKIQISDVDSESCGVEVGEGRRAPSFESAASQFSERLGERAKPWPRGRDDWECDFCGAECFCDGFGD